MRKFIFSLCLLCLASVVLPAQEQKLKTVLFEEFTGEWCPYCPEEYPAIERMAEALKNQGVEANIIAYHINDVFSLEKNDYVEAYLEVTGYPSTSVNRSYDVWQKTSLITPLRGIGNAKSYAEDLVKTYTERAEFTKTSAELKGGKELEVKLEGRILKSVDRGNCYLTAVVTEDNVQGIAQRNLADPAKSGKNYIHQHIARKFLTGAFGEDLNPEADGSFTINLMTTEIDDTWKKENLRVVVFVNKNIRSTNKTERFVLTSKTLKIKDVKGEDSGKTTAVVNLQSELPKLSLRAGKIFVQGAYDSIEIFDLEGRLIARDTEGSFAKGVYVVRLKHSGKTSIFKLKL